MEWKCISSIIRTKADGQLYFTFTWADFYSETCCLVLKGGQTSWWTAPFFSSYRWCPCSSCPIWSSDCNGQTCCRRQSIHREKIWDPRRVSEALLEEPPLSKSREPSWGRAQDAEMFASLDLRITNIKNKHLKRFWPFLKNVTGPMRLVWWPYFSFNVCFVCHIVKSKSRKNPVWVTRRSRNCQKLAVAPRRWNAPDLCICSGMAFIFLSFLLVFHSWCFSFNCFFYQVQDTS